ncbi:SUF system NifU family Fe-S cluster assembly protein [candidate division WWE3 bacterium]|nr:SUF system NifU family Fe-S cluster assembly protein [candidate division WWE3 bacterium]
MDSIYREQLMEHYKDPQNRGQIMGADVTEHQINPFCGDTISLQLKIINGVITDIAFEGDACAVSIASSSLVTEYIKGKTLIEAKLLDKEKVLELLGVELTTSRVKCALLVLDALQEAIKKYETLNPVLDKNLNSKFIPLTKDSNIAQAVMKYPAIAEVLLDYGLHCVGCFANTFDSIETGAKIHGYLDEEIDEMVERINEVVQFGE